MHGTKAGGIYVEVDAGAGPTPSPVAGLIAGLARVKTAPRPMPSPKTAEHGAPADDAPLHRSKSFEAGPLLTLTLTLTLTLPLPLPLTQSS
jgi:hypothetical protein